MKLKPRLVVTVMTSFVLTCVGAPTQAAAPSRADQPLAVSSKEQAEQLAREAVAQYYNSTPVSPEECYDLSVARRDDGNYDVQVTQHPGETCEVIDYGRSFQPFSIEIDATRGSVVVVDYPSRHVKPREVKLFRLEDVPGMPVLQRTNLNWELEGDTKQLAHAQQCRLSMHHPAFEQMNGYSFGLTAKREDRTLTVSYHVNTVGAAPLPDGAHAALVFKTGQDTLASYEASIDLRDDLAGPATTNDAWYSFDLKEKAAYDFLRVLGQSTRMEPSINQESMSGMALWETDFASAGGGSNINGVVTEAFARCLDQIWK